MLRGGEHAIGTSHTRAGLHRWRVVCVSYSYCYVASPGRPHDSGSGVTTKPLVIHRLKGCNALRSTSFRRCRCVFCSRGKRIAAQRLRLLHVKHEMRYVQHRSGGDRAACSLSRGT
eukprot:460626-Prymnesium_polylepis.2